jgi:predicted ATPase/class 3 adenylate cyclase/Flp pilus assembly protein TadD
MPEAPTGIVTLVFTDIQGSTALWEYFAGGFKALLNQHNALFRAAILEFGGYEVKTEGDAFMVAFQDAVPAVAMCLAMQERLNAADWPDSLNDEAIAHFAGATEDGAFRGLRVRMGVHTGTPDCQPDPVTGRMDYFGREVNRAARVGSVGHGGQLLVSEATWEAVGKDGLPAGTVIEDLDEHALKGLERREHLRQLLPASLAERCFPRLKTPNLKKTNLPTRLDSFFGREPEIEELKQRIAIDQRLITLLGAGGTGKTRLSQRFGATQFDSFPGGVWFCDLTEARSKAGLISAMGAALEVPLTSHDPAAQLANAILARGRVLFILDNFEQVVEHADETVGHWLQRAPEAVFLVTSRTLLRIDGEEVLYLDPLPVAEAVNLFYDRARALQPGFVRTDENEPMVTEIVERLDCMSLAVELAAARIRMLPPEQILQRLSQRFKLLRGQRRDHSARQATLRATIDWSWELLQAHEQSALSQLSVFRGGCTLEAAEAVVDLDAFEEQPWVMDVVEALVDHSLLRRVEPHSGHVRYRMLESIREYAAEKLGAESKLAEATALRHGSHFASLGTGTFIESLDTHGGVQRHKFLKLELENLLAGVDAGLAAEEPEVAAGCALAAAQVLAMHGPYSDGIALLERVLGQPVGRGTQGRLFHRGGWLLKLAGRPAEALRHCQQALEIDRELGYRRGEGVTLGDLAIIHADQGRLPEALQHYQQALEMAREVGDRRGEGSILANLAILHADQGRLPEALEHYQQSLTIAREVGDRLLEGNTLGNLANLHQQQGCIPEALEHYQQALEIASEVGNRRNEGVSLGNLGDLLFSQGDLPSAETRLREAIAISDEVFPLASGAFRGSLALLRAQQGTFDEARALLDKGEAQLRGVHKLELGKLLCKKARVEHLAGDPAAAAFALAEAEAIAVELGAGAGSELGVALVETRAEMET